MGIKDQISSFVTLVEALNGDILQNQKLFQKVWNTFEREVCNSIDVGSISKLFPLNVFHNIQSHHKEFFGHFLKSCLNTNLYKFNMDLHKFSCPPLETYKALSFAVALVKAPPAAKIVSIDLKIRIWNNVAHLRQLNAEAAELDFDELTYEHKAISVSEHHTGVCINSTMSSLIEHMRSIAPKTVQGFIERPMKGEENMTYEEFMSMQTDRQFFFLLWCLFRVGGKAFQNKIKSLNPKLRKNPLFK